MLLRFARWILLAAGILRIQAADPEIRIAFTPFTTDDHSHRSWKGVADLSDRVLAELHSVPGVTWVERIELKRLEDERVLASAGLATPSLQTRLEAADWSLSVHFDEVVRTSRACRIAIHDLRLGRILAATNLALQVAARSRIDADSDLAMAVLEGTRKTLEEAKRRHAASSGLRRGLWLDLDPPAAPEGWEFIRPVPTVHAGNEAELAAVGWTRSAGLDDWRDVELIAWPHTNNPRFPGAGTVRVWVDGGLHVLAQESLASWSRLPPPSWGEGVELAEAARFAAEALETTGRAEFDGTQYFSDRESWTRWRRGIRRLSLACWLLPERRNAQEILARARFPRHALEDVQDPVRWGYRMRDLWGEHVSKHGLESVATALFQKAADRPEFQDFPDTVAANYLLSAVLVVSREPTFADIDSRALERIRTQAVAELRVRLTRTLGLPGLEALRTKALSEVLTYGVGQDSKAWSEWFDREAERLPRETTPELLDHPKELRWQLEKIYSLAGRPGAEAEPFRKLLGDRPLDPPAPARPEVVKLALPRVSQLDSLSVRPALDGGDLGLGPTVVPEAVRAIDLPAETHPAAAAWGSGGDVWLWAFQSESAPPPDADSDLRRDASVRSVGLLLRSRSGKPFQPLRRNPLTGGIQQLVSHQGEVWGGTSSNVWRIPRNGDTPEPAGAGLGGFARLFPTGDRLLAFSGTVFQWVPGSNRWEMRMRPTPLPNPGNQTAMAVRGDTVWMRRSQSMNLPPGMPNPRPYPWLRWNGSRWEPTGFPEAEKIQFDQNGNAWCTFDSRLRVLSPDGSDLWTGNVPANPVVWRDPISVLSLHEPIPPPLDASNLAWGQHVNPTYKDEFGDSELFSLERSVRDLLVPRTAPRPRLGLRIEDPVLHVALDGDRLWIAALRRTHRRGPHTRVTLLHAPTRRWIASVDLPDRILDWSVGPDGVLARTGLDTGTLTRKTPLHRIDAAVLLKVPESRWLPADPTKAELETALSKLEPRPRAIRAWMDGDPVPLRQLLRGVKPDSASAEDLFLLAATAEDEPGRKTVLEVLLRDHPGSLFSAVVRKTIQPKP